MKTYHLGLSEREAFDLSLIFGEIGGTTSPPENSIRITTDRVWDALNNLGMNANKLVHYNNPLQDKRLGDVGNVPLNRPAIPTEVKLTDDYTATVTKEAVVVGCQKNPLGEGGSVA